ncbi:MAG: flippase [Omnitrophica bacterium]|nr:flippase [Candidatus Omnitrophota bacterium]
MSVAKKVATNTLFLILGKIVTIFVQIIIISLLARYLGVSGYGKYAFVFAYLSFFQVLCNAGLDSILVREISREKSLAAKLIGLGVIIRFFISVAAFLLAVLIITLLGYPQDITKAIYILSLILLFSSLRTPELIFQVYLKSQYPALINLLTKFLTLGLISLAIHQKGNLIFIIWMILAANLASNSAVIIYSRRFVVPKFSFNLNLFKRVIKESWPVALTAIAITVYFKIDTIMLSFMKGDEAVGYYSAPYGIMATLIFIPAAYVTSIFPVISEYFKSSVDSLTKVFKRSFKYLFTLALPIVVGGVILSGDIIIFVFGDKFYSSINVFRILIFAMGIIFISNLVTNVIIATNRQKINLWLVLANVALNISLNLILIPRWSYIGASIATVFTEGLGCSLALFLNLKYFKLRFFSKRYLNILKPFLAAAVMAVVIFCLHAAHFLVIIPIAGLVYIGALFIFRWFDKVDLSLFKEILKTAR